MFQFLERQVALSNPLSEGEMDAPASKMEREALSITTVCCFGPFAAFAFSARQTLIYFEVFNAGGLDLLKVFSGLFW